LIQLYNDDCLDVLPTLSDKSIDLILTDLPYETTNWTKEKWDVGLPFDLVWEQIKRVRKEKISVVLFGQEPFSTKLRYSNLDEFKYDWIWIKKNKTGFLNAKVKPLKQYEIISVFSDGTTSPNRSNNMPYYPQGLEEDNQIITQKRTGSFNMAASIRKDATYTKKHKNYPSNLLYFNRPKENFHPTQKPTDLLEYLIKTYSKENETVLDFTMGSGSTGVACKNLNRKFIGIEKDQRYFEIAKKRIDNVLI
jgi:site-specific DNA-methyltransferase (adenine-specific)